MAAARNKLLVLNAGSSSLKFKLFEVLGPLATGLRGATGATSAASASSSKGGGGGSGGSGGSAAQDAREAAAAAVGLHSVASGLCERIGDPAGGAVMKAAAATDWRKAARKEVPMPDHGAALRQVAQFLEEAFFPDFHSQVLGVGHRVVHGGTIGESVLVDEAAKATLREASELAPLHNPPNLYCIEAAQQLFPEAPHVAVFDTTFHATMPPEAYTYALPTRLASEHRIRRYGFHGISYSYLTREAARMLGKPPEQCNLILCHLGAGSSMCAVTGGRSVETTMGFTPLEGLMMGTRCGDIDPAILPYLMGKGFTATELDEMMNKQSGFLGLAGSIDVRTVEECALKGDEECLLALAVYLRRIRKYLGAYLVHLGGQVDAIVFSAGIGENGSMLRELALSGLEWAGISVDRAANDAAIRGRTGQVQAPGSRVKVLVIPADEQLEIAEQTLEVVRRHTGQLARAA